MSTLNNNTTNNNTAASTPRKSFRFEPYQMNYSRVWLGNAPTTTATSTSTATTASTHNANNMSLISGASDDPMLSSSSLEESGALHALSITTPLHVCAAAPAPKAVESMSASSSIESEDEEDNSGDTTNYASDSDENENHHHREDGEMPSANAAAVVADSTVDEDEDIEKPTKTAEAQRAPTRTMQHLLQTVPYLFLDTVALATAQSQDRARTHQTRVGDSVSAWSGSNASTLGSISGGGDIKDIFVAQLPFDMPLSALQELADLLITDEPRIQIVHAAPHYRKGRAYDGCAFLKMSEGDAHRFIDALHKRVLFDVDGVWVASTPQEVRELTDYCAWMQELRPDQRRQILHIPTPFSALTAEFALRATRGATTINNNQPPFPHHAGMMMPHHQHHQHQLHQHHHGASQASSSVMSTPPLGPAPASSSADHTVADAPMLGGMMAPAQPMFFASHASSSSYHMHQQQQPRNAPYYAQHHSAQHAQHVMPISTAAATAAAFCDPVPVQPLHYNGPSSAQYHHQHQSNNYGHHQQQQQQYPGYANNNSGYYAYSAQRPHHGTF